MFSQSQEDWVEFFLIEQNIYSNCFGSGGWLKALINHLELCMYTRHILLGERWVDRCGLHQMHYLHACYALDQVDIHTQSVATYFTVWPTVLSLYSPTSVGHCRQIPIGLYLMISVATFSV